jgi:hypothetical protein
MIKTITGLRILALKLDRLSNRSGRLALFADNSSAYLCRMAAKHFIEE